MDIGLSFIIYLLAYALKSTLIGSFIIVSDYVLLIIKNIIFLIINYIIS